MAETTTRPFWKVRRFWGGLIGTLGATALTIPSAPVLISIGAVAITTQTVGVLLTGIGTYVFGYGQAKAVDRAEAKKGSSTTSGST